MIGAIRDPAAYIAAALRRRTERFNECFPRGISFGDIDGYVEINGYLLFVEWKCGNQIVPTGQMRAQLALARLPEATAVFVWTNDAGDIQHYMVAGDMQTRVPIDDAEFTAAVKAWAAAADAAAPPKLRYA